MLSDLFMIIGPVILGIAMGPITLCFGRLLIGCGLGISLMISPVFLQEAAPSGLRNQIVPTYFFMYFVGMILSYFGGIWFETGLFSLFGVAVIPAIL